MVTKMWIEYEKQNRMEICIQLDGGHNLYTHFDGSKEEAEKRYIGKKISMGKEMITCTAVSVVSS